MFSNTNRNHDHNHVLTNSIRAGKMLLPIFITACLIILAVTLGGCAPKGYIAASQFKELATPVLNRHDAMLKGELDPATDVSEVERGVWLDSSSLLRMQLEEATKSSE